MSTHEQFIERETASLARKAGFDWKVTSFYNPEGKVCYCSSACNMNCEIGAYYDLSRPTQSVLQRWLREVKGYSIYVTRGGYEIYVLDDNDSAGFSRIYGLNSVLSYEEALESGIVKCLEKILKEE